MITDKIRFNGLKGTIMTSEQRFTMAMIRGGLQREVIYGEMATNRKKISSQSCQ